jgi:hypothetical protein
MSKFLTDRARTLPVLVVAVVTAVASTLVVLLAGPSTGTGGSTPGTTVAWTNKDATEHTATADSGPSFDTGAIQQGQMRTITFTKPGTYAYHCGFHPFMTATVVVR